MSRRKMYLKKRGYFKMGSPQLEDSQGWRCILDENLGLPECPRCKTVYDDPSIKKSDPVLDTCAHPKCRKCFIESHEEPCAKCSKEVVEPEWRSRIRMNGVVSPVRSACSLGKRKSPLNIESLLTVTDERLRPRKIAKKDDKKVSTKKTTGKKLPREFRYFYHGKTSPSMYRLAKVVARIPKCSECGTFWSEQGSGNSGPVLIGCGHFKCRKCFMAAMDSNNYPCNQCVTKHWDNIWNHFNLTPAEREASAWELIQLFESLELKKLAKTSCQPDRLTPVKKVAAGKGRPHRFILHYLTKNLGKFHPKNKTKTKDLVKTSEIHNAQKKLPELNGQRNHQNGTPIFRKSSEEEKLPTQIVSLNSLISPEPRAGSNDIEKNPQGSQPPDKEIRTIDKALEVENPKENAKRKTKETVRNPVSLDLIKINNIPCQPDLTPGKNGGGEKLKELEFHPKNKTESKNLVKTSELPNAQKKQPQLIGRLKNQNGTPILIYRQMFEEKNPLPQIHSMHSFARPQPRAGRNTVEENPHKSQPPAKKARTTDEALEVGNPKEIERRNIPETVRNSVSLELMKLPDISYQLYLTPTEKVAAGEAEEVISLEQEKFHPENTTKSKDLIKRADLPNAQEKKPVLNEQTKNQNGTAIFIAKQVSEEETLPPQVTAFNSLVSPEPRAGGRNTVEENPHKSQSPAKTPQAITKDDGPTMSYGKKRNVPGGKGEMKNHSNCGSKAEVLENLREQSFQPAPSSTKDTREGTRLTEASSRKCLKRNSSVLEVENPKEIRQRKTVETERNSETHELTKFHDSSCQSVLTPVNKEAAALELGKSKEIEQGKSAETMRNSKSLELKKLPQTSYQPDPTPVEKVAAGKGEELKTVSIGKEKFHPENKTASKDLIKSAEIPNGQEKQTELNGQTKNQNGTPIIMKRQGLEEEKQITSINSLTSPEPLVGGNNIKKNPNEPQPPNKKSRNLEKALEVENPKEIQKRKTVETVRNSVSLEFIKMNDISYQPGLTPGKKLGGGKVEELKHVSFEQEKFHPLNKTESKDLAKRPEVPNAQEKQPQLNGRIKNQNGTRIVMCRQMFEEKKLPEIHSFYSFARPGPRAGRNTVEENPRKYQPPAKKARTVDEALEGGKRKNAETDRNSVSLELKKMNDISCEPGLTRGKNFAGGKELKTVSFEQDKFHPGNKTGSKDLVKKAELPNAQKKQPELNGEQKKQNGLASPEPPAGRHNIETNPHECQPPAKKPRTITKDGSPNICNGSEGNGEMKNHSNCGSKAEVKENLREQSFPPAPSNAKGIREGTKLTEATSTKCLERNSLVLEVDNPQEIRQRKTVETEKTSESLELKKLPKISYQPDLTPVEKVGAGKEEFEAFSFKHKKFRRENKTKSEDLIKRAELPNAQEKQPELNGPLKNQNGNTIVTTQQIFEEKTPPPQITPFNNLASPEPRAGRNIVEENPHKSHPPPKTPRAISKGDGPTTYNCKKSNIPGGKGETKNHSNVRKADVLENLREENFQPAANVKKGTREGTRSDQHTSRKNLKRNSLEKRREAEKPLSCAKCARRFQTEDNLKLHLSIHLADVLKSKFTREALLFRILKIGGKNSINPKTLGKVPSNEKPSDLPGTSTPENLPEESFPAAPRNTKGTREENSINPKPLGNAPSNEKPSDLPGTSTPLYHCQHCRKTFCDFPSLDHHIKSKHTTLEVENPQGIRQGKTHDETERNSDELTKLPQISYQAQLTPVKNVGAGNVEEIETNSCGKDKFHPGNETASKDLLKTSELPNAQKNQPELKEQLKNQNGTKNLENMPIIIEEETPSTLEKLPEISYQPDLTPAENVGARSVEEIDAITFELEKFHLEDETGSREWENIAEFVNRQIIKEESPPPPKITDVYSLAYTPSPGGIDTLEENNPPKSQPPTEKPRTTDPKSNAESPIPSHQSVRERNIRKDVQLSPECVTPRKSKSNKSPACLEEILENTEEILGI